MRPETAFDANQREHFDLHGNFSFQSQPSLAAAVYKNGAF